VCCDIRAHISQDLERRDSLCFRLVASSVQLKDGRTQVTDPFGLGQLDLSTGLLAQIVEEVLVKASVLLVVRSNFLLALDLDADVHANRTRHGRLVGPLLCTTKQRFDVECRQTLTNGQRRISLNFTNTDRPTNRGASQLQKWEI